MARSKKKPELRPFLFVGGSRDGTWHELLEDTPAVRIAPRQILSEYVFQKTDGDGDETVVHVQELYTRRDLSFEDGDLAYFAIDELEDLQAVERLLQGFVGRPTIYHQVEDAIVPLPPELHDAIANTLEIPNNRQLKQPGEAEKADSLPAFLRRQAD